MSVLVTALPAYRVAAERLATALDLPFRLTDVHRFPDGESKVTVPAEPPETVIMCQSLDRPNDKLVALMLASATLRELGARRLLLVAPYLCYMRQDTAFHPGEAVSQRIVGRHLASLVDGLVTVDAHLHRVHDLHEAVPLETAINLSAAPLLGAFLAERDLDPLLLGPDAESAQWVEQVARAGGFDYAVATKDRLGDRQVRIHLPDVDLRGRCVVLVDDVLSSGLTLAMTAREAKAAGAAAVHALVTHALFAEGAETVLRAAGVEHIWSTDAIPHPSNTVPLAGLLADTVRPLL